MIEFLNAGERARAMSDILERLRVTPTVTLPQSESMIPAATAIRQMMIERAEAMNAIEVARKERDELSADLAALREATRVRLSQKAIASLRELLETMEALDDEDAFALRVLIAMHDKLGGARP